MAIQVSSFIVPRSGNKWYVLEDKYIKGGLQIAATIEERDAILEENRKAGMLVVVQADFKIYQLETDLLSWREFKTGGASAVRQRVEFSTRELAPGESQSFPLDLGRSALIYELSVDTPCMVEAHSTVLRDESNPYKFLATSDHLYDDGSSLLSDGTVLRGRRFSILANLEEGDASDIYFRITNTDTVAKAISIKINFLPLE